MNLSKRKTPQQQLLLIPLQLLYASVTYREETLSTLTCLHLFSYWADQKSDSSIGRSET